MREPTPNDDVLPASLRRTCRIGLKWGKTPRDPDDEAGYTVPVSLHVGDRDS
mgnify:CR=1 FL=1